MFNIGDRVVVEGRGSGEIVENYDVGMELNRLVMFDEVKDGYTYHQGVMDNFPDRCWYCLPEEMEPETISMEND